MIESSYHQPEMSNQTMRSRNAGGFWLFLAGRTKL